jgi:hypothetical protein
MLVELLRELARQQAIANTLRAARREPADDQWSEARAALLKESRARIGRIVVPQISDVSPLVVDRSALIVDKELKVIPVNLFI